MAFGFGMGFPRNEPFAGGPSLNLQFAGNTVLDPAITFTRALNTATYFNSAGVLTTANANVARFDYDPATLAPRGLLIEEARTNSIRNNTMQGAVAGTPGTLPTNWTPASSTVDNLSREIVAVGVQNGISYIDVRWSGTSGTAGNSTLLTFEPNSQIAASNGQTWTGSVYASLVGGSLSNVSLLSLSVRFNDAVGTSLTSQNQLFTPTASVARVTNIFTAANASTAFVNTTLIANFADNSAVDFTLRIGLPQLEQGAFATSVIPTTTTALTRNADVASVTGASFSAFYSQTAWTVYAEYAGIASGGASAGAEAPYVFGFNNSGTAGFDGYAVRDVLNSTSRPTVVGRNGATTPSTSVSYGAYRVAAQIYKTAAAMDSGGLYITADAKTVATTTNTVFGLDTQNQMLLGFGDTGGSSPYYLNGWLRRITYYPRKLSSAELQAITS